MEAYLPWRRACGGDGYVEGCLTVVKERDHGGMLQINILLTFI